ncbi:sulfatase-like hydrolase/transferase [Halococcus salifodinae]
MREIDKFLPCFSALVRMEIESGRYNILLIVWDTVRADFTTPYQTDINTTPTLANFAEEGLLFENAYSASNWTGTSHGALFSGQYPTQSGVIGVDNQNLPADRSTLLEIVHEQGYRTFFGASNSHLRSEYGYGRGADTYLNPSVPSVKEGHKHLNQILMDSTVRASMRQQLFAGRDNQAKYTARRFLEFIKNKESATPWFGFLNFLTAHHPYDPPRPYKRYFDRDLSRPRSNWQDYFGIGEETHDEFSIERLTTLSEKYPVFADEFSPIPGEWSTIRSWYAGAIRYLDDLTAALRDRLQVENEWNDTVIIITSDHGEYFGECGLEKHNFGLDDPVVKIPMVFRIPPSLQNEIQDDGSPLVSLIDLYPTICHIAGGEPPAGTTGVDLLSQPLASDTDRFICSEVAKKPTDAIERRHEGFTDHPKNQGRQAIRTVDGVIEFVQNGETHTWGWNSDLSNIDRDMSRSDLIEDYQESRDIELGSLPEDIGVHPIYGNEQRERLKHLGYL